MGTCINLEFGDGDFEHGFKENQLVVKVSTSESKTIQIIAQLSPSSEIPLLCKNWQEEYNFLSNELRTFKKNQTTHISSQNCYKQAQALRRQLDKWLQPLKLQLEPILKEYADEEMHLVIHTQNVRESLTKNTLHRLPWQEWELFPEDVSAEAALCFKACMYKIVTLTQPDWEVFRRVKIISIFGDNVNINTEIDEQLINELEKRAADCISLKQPSLAQLEILWNEHPDILFFAGHSETQDDGQTGIIKINSNENLNLEAIQKTLRAARKQGLKLAIFNSCDGLGLARQLADFVPYVIVWQEPVPDKIAQQFLKFFLSSYSHGKSLFTAVREARDKLEELTKVNNIQKLPGINWLPKLCINTLELPPSWEDLGGLNGKLPNCPYQGLAAFAEENANYFFGRENFVEELVAAVVETKPLVPIVGASGSGKSSVVFAGLVPRLRKMANVKIVSFRPGNNPFDKLAIALSQYYQSLAASGELPTDIKCKLEQLILEVDLRHNQKNLVQLIETIISPNNFTVNIEVSGRSQLVLIADQFEELYTLAPQEERQAFLDSLIYAIKYVPGFTLVLTLRADFYGHALSYRPFSDALQKGIYNLGPMNREELYRAITQPSAKMKVALEEGLTDTLIKDLGNQPGRLPLLEFTLTQLWLKPRKGFLTFQGYKEIGGLEKALANHADTVLEELNLIDYKRAEIIFIQLVRPGEGTEDTRRIATKHEIGENNWDLVQWLADKRLVVTGYDESSKDNQETVEIIHEALIREWETFREWIQNNRKFRIWQEGLKQQVREWLDNFKDTGRLLQETPLSIAMTWYADSECKNKLTPQEKEFIFASIEKQNKQVKQQKFRRNLTIFGLISGLTIVSIFAALSEIRRSNTEMLQLSVKSRQVYDSGNENEGLIGSIKAGKQLQNNIWGLWLPLNTKIEIIDALRYQLASQPNIITHTSKGHSGAVFSVSFSPDGKTIASASYDKTVKLWDANTGRLLNTLKGHEREVKSVSFSPDGKTVASASHDKTVKLWDANTGRLLNTLKGHSNSVFSVSFSPDGKTIASASLDKTVKLWDAKTGRLLNTLKGHESEVRSVSFSPDGKTIASASYEKTVKLWDAKTGQELNTLKGHSGYIYSVSFSPDSKTVASASLDGTVKLWNAKTGHQFNTLKGHSGCVSSVSFSPDGKTIASASDDSTVKLWDASTGRLLNTLNGHSGVVYSVSFSPDGKTVTSASLDGTVKLWDANTGQLVNTFKRDFGLVSSVSFSPDGETVASASHDGTVKLWDANTGHLLNTLKGHSGLVSSVSFSPDGKTIASASHDGTVKLWEANTGRLVNTLKGNSRLVYSISFSPDGKTIASASHDGTFDSTVKLWDANTGHLVNTLIGHSNNVYNVSFSPDSKTVASASHDGTVKLWDTNTGRLVNTLIGHSNNVYNVSFSPDGKTVASASQDGTVKLWDVNTGRLLNTLKGHSGLVSSVSFSPDSKTVASASSDGTVKVWDANTGRELNTLRRRSGSVNSLNFSPDSKTIRFASSDGAVRKWNLDTGSVITNIKGGSDTMFDISISPNGKLRASASSDNTIKLWDNANNQVLKTLEAHSAEVLSVSFSTDGSSLASASSDTTVKLWNTETGQLIKTLKGHLSSVNSVRFSPDGKIIASASDDGTVKLWDANTGKEIKTLKGHSRWVNSVNFSTDGKRLVSASSDGTVKVWDIASGGEINKHQELDNKDKNKRPIAINGASFSPDGKIIAFATDDEFVGLWDINTNNVVSTPRRHNGKVNSVNFSPDGKIIVSASDGKNENPDENVLKLWDATTGREIVTLKKHLAPVNSVNFLPDGNTIVSASNDGTYIVWDFDLDRLLKRGCSELKLNLHNNEADRSNMTEEDKRVCDGVK